MERQQPRFLPVSIFPTDPSQLTAEWLTEALRRVEGHDHLEVQALQVEPLGSGRGLVGQLARVRLTYGAGRAGPPTLIAKFGAADPVSRAALNRLRLPEREVRFYRELAAQVPVRTPRCYHGNWDPGTGESVLLLEDIRAAREGDNVAGCTPAEARLCLDHLARLHAAWWQHARLGELSWVPAQNSGLEVLQSVYEQALPRFVEAAEGLAPPPLLELSARLADRLPAVRQRLGEAPTTLLHYDFRLDNLLFGLPDAPLAVLDWQLVSRGAAVNDLAYFLTWSLPVEVRRAEEPGLAEAYLAALRARGVSQYGAESLAEHLPDAYLNCLVRLVVAGGLLDWSSERGRSLLAQLLQRTAAALLDHHADALL